MSTVILVWLLISLPGSEGSSANVPTTTVAQFFDVAECERVKAVIKNQGNSYQTKLICIQTSGRIYR